METILLLLALLLSSPSENNKVFPPKDGKVINVVNTSTDSVLNLIR